MVSGMEDWGDFVERLRFDSGCSSGSTFRDLVWRGVRVSGSACLKFADSYGLWSLLADAGLGS